MKSARAHLLTTAISAAVLLCSTAARAAPSCDGFFGQLLCDLFDDGGGSGGSSGSGGHSGSGGGSGGQTQPAPEPLTLAGLAIGGAGLAWAKRRRANKR